MYEKNSNFSRSTRLSGGETSSPPPHPARETTRQETPCITRGCASSGESRSVLSARFTTVRPETHTHTRPYGAARTTISNNNHYRYPLLLPSFIVVNFFFFFFTAVRWISAENTRRYSTAQHRGDRCDRRPSEFILLLLLLSSFFFFFQRRLEFFFVSQKKKQKQTINALLQSI